MKYSTVRPIPVSRSTLGSQPSSFRARVMSGWRWRGSSSGSGRNTSRDFGPGEPDDHLGKLEHGELLGISHVHRPVNPSGVFIIRISPSIRSST